MWTPGEPPQRRRGLCGRAAGRTRAACPEPRVTVGGARVDRPWPPEEHGALATSASRATFCLCASAFSSHLWFSLHPSGGSQAGRPPPRRCARERGEAGGAPGRPARASLPCGSPHVARCGWLASPWPRGGRGMRLPPGSLRLSRRRRLLRRCGPQEAFAGDAALGAQGRHGTPGRRGGAACRVCTWPLRSGGAAWGGWGRAPRGLGSASPALQRLRLLLARTVF